MLLVIGWFCDGNKEGDSWLLWLLDPSSASSSPRILLLRLASSLLLCSSQTFDVVEVDAEDQSSWSEADRVVAIGNGRLQLVLLKAIDCQMQRKDESGGRSVLKSNTLSTCALFPLSSEVILCWVATGSFSLFLSRLALTATMSYFLVHLPSGWHVDQAILAEEDRVVCIRFGQDHDSTCMKMDETLYGVSERVKNFAVIYLVDITQVPDFNKVSFWSECI
jgi:hypothetical protein